MNNYLLLLLWCCFFIFGSSKPCGPESWIYPQDGIYNTSSDIKENILNVHLIPHSHDDPGWLKTIDQYYYGSKRNVGGQGVQYILDEVIDELLKNPNRRFMFVEQSFFTIWWNEQSSHMKTVVRKLVAEGRLDLGVNGGWVMHDEANTHFTAMIDQTTLGHQFLKREFNVIPKIGWQIDPFGHSLTQALLSMEMGFKALYFSRIDLQDYQLRMKDANMEFMWRPHSNKPETKISKIFTGVTQGGYGPPGNLLFEGEAEPLNDNPNLYDNNICERVEQVVLAAKEYASHVKGNHIFFPMGDDFNFQNAHMQFKNIDKLIHYVNQDKRINMFYSTLSKYTDAKLAQNIPLQEKHDDFFPYGSSPHGYWTGYFTSRPTFKRLCRVANGFLQAAKQLEVYTPQKKKDSQLGKLAQAVALVQHHDAITGTQKQEVAWDYAMRLSEGLDEAEKLVASSVQKLSSSDASSSDASSSDASSFDFCWLRNVSICETTQNNEKFRVWTYNPLAIDTREQLYVRIPVSKKYAIVKDQKNKIVKSQVIPVSPTPYVIHGAMYNLIFPTTSQGLGVSQYEVTMKENKMEKEVVHQGTPGILRNEFLEVAFTADGHLKSMKTLHGKNQEEISISLQHDFAYYTSYQGNQGDKSGAYLFRPDSRDAIPVNRLNFSSPLQYHFGEHVQEVTVQVNEWISVTYRLYRTSSSLEVEWTVGEIPVGDGQGKEVISRFTTDILSSATWYTDSNGREYLKRQRNHRPSWNVSLEEPVAGNYFPITTGVYIRDEEKQLNILTDRAQGTTSLQDGQIEIMVHRRLLYDDSKGVNEALNESEVMSDKNQHGVVAKGTFYLTLGKPSESGKLLRQVMDEVFSPIVSFFQSSTTFNSENSSNVLKGVNCSRLPSQIALQTLEKVDESTVLLRLSHKFAQHEHQDLAVPVQVDIKDYFPKNFVQSYQEVSITGNQPISTLHTSKVNSNDRNNKVISIQPMEIRTFLVKVKSGRFNRYLEDEYVEEEYIEEEYKEEEYKEEEYKEEEYKEEEYKSKTQAIHVAYE